MDRTVKYLNQYREDTNTTVFVNTVVFENFRTFKMVGHDDLQQTQSRTATIMEHY